MVNDTAVSVTTAQRLRVWNIVAGFAHLVQFLLIVVLSTDQPARYRVVSGWPARHPDR